MSSTPMASQFDLLREKRQELNLPEPAEASIQGRRWLVQGVVIGAALVGVSLGVAVLVFLRGLMVSSAIEGLGTVEAEVQLFETQLNVSRAKLKGVDKANQDLVKGLLAVRSGSAVLRDLQMRVPEKMQLMSAVVEGSGYRLMGVINDSLAFKSFNALEILLRRSPLLDPNTVSVVKACRREITKEPLSCLYEKEPPISLAFPSSPARKPPVQLAPEISFEIFVKFRPAISPLAEKQILTQLGSEGLVRRLDLLQKEGLL